MRPSHGRWKAGIRGPQLLVLVLLAAAACTPAQQPGPARGGVPGTGAAAPAQPAADQTTAEPWRLAWEQTLAAARQEGKVVVYGSQGDLLRKNMVDGFRNAFPEIAIEWSGVRPPVQAAQVEAERRAGIYSGDVFNLGTTTGITQLKPIGALDPVRPALILPEVTDPRNWLDNRLDFADKDELVLVFVGIPRTNAIYDPNQVKPDEIDNLYDLLDPKWKGKIVLNDPTVSGSGQSAMRFFWQALGPEKGAEFIRAFKEQVAVVDREERRQVEWIARGRYAILVGGSDTVMSQLKKEGMRFDSVVEFKDYGTVLTSSGGAVSILNNAPHPNAAKVFINWLLTREGQVAYSTAVGQASRRVDVPTDHIPADSIPRAGAKYWASYYEEYVNLPPELQSLLREVFTR
jgi:ABC-type Fe3+ transport system substrate-binding protein